MFRIRGFSLFVILTIGLSLVTSTAALAADTDIIHMPDAALKAVVNETIGGSRAPNTDITVGEAKQITEINGNNKNIANLTGLENFTNLEALSLNGNKITDVIPLQGLTQLRWLQLNDNQVSNISAIASLTELYLLSLERNGISNLSTLSGLSKLQYLHLSDDTITSITPLANLTSLGVLALESNNLTDISPLVSLENLRYLELRGNKISDFSPLATLSNLSDLAIVSWALDDVAVFGGLTELSELLLVGGTFTDISPLAGLTNITTFYSQQALTLDPIFTGSDQISPVVDLDGNWVRLTSTDPGFRSDGALWTFTTPGHKTLNWSTEAFGGTFSGEIYVEVKDVAFSDVPKTHKFHDEIVWLATSGVTSGYSDGTFRPKNLITREAMAAFLYRSVGARIYIPPLVSPFTDVPTTHNFYRELTWLASTGVTTGYSDGTFRSKNLITREAMAAFLYRAAQSPAFTPPEKSPFKDVPTTHKFYKELTWLASTGVTTGYSDGTFRPKNQITREATAAFLYRAHEKSLFGY